MSVNDEFFVCKECGKACSRARNRDYPFCFKCMSGWNPGPEGVGANADRALSHDEQYEGSTDWFYREYD